MLWRVLRGTVSACAENRATGLAAEGAFFAVLALPPLVFGLAGSIGYVVGMFGERAVNDVRIEIVNLARNALTEESVQQVIAPTLDSVLGGGRVEILSIGFLLALWSGSRAVHTAIDGTRVMYGTSEGRGLVKERLLSFWLYVIGLGVGVVALPLALVGPELVGLLLPEQVDFLVVFYWPVVVVVSTVLLGAFFHLAGGDPRGTRMRRRGQWRHDLPGAIVAMLLWIIGSLLLRVFLTFAVGGVSIYGPLAAPIVVLLWLYVVVFALLVGAAVNAAVHRV